MLEKQEKLYIIECIVVFWQNDILVRASGFLHAVFKLLLPWLAQFWIIHILVSLDSSVSGGFDIGGRAGARRILFGILRSCDRAS